MLIWMAWSFGDRLPKQVLFGWLGKKHPFSILWSKMKMEGYSEERLAWTHGLRMPLIGVNGMRLVVKERRTTN